MSDWHESQAARCAGPEWERADLDEWKEAAATDAAEYAELLAQAAGVAAVLDLDDDVLALAMLRQRLKETTDDRIS